MERDRKPALFVVIGLETVVVKEAHLGTDAAMGLKREGVGLFALRGAQEVHPKQQGLLLCVGGDLQSEGSVFAACAAPFDGSIGVEDDGLDDIGLIVPKSKHAAV